MKGLIIYFLFFMLSNGAFAQKSVNELAVQVFTNQYQRQVIDKFKGKIENIGDTLIKYDNIILKFNDDKKYLSIFTSGLFYPEVINKASIYKDQKKIQLQIEDANAISNTTISQEQFENLTDNNNLIFTAFNELTYLNKNKAVKRFSFWIYRKGLLNPTEYYFELTNKQATKQTDLKKFIEGAKLTFIKCGSLII